MRLSGEFAEGSFSFTIFFALANAFINENTP